MFADVKLLPQSPRRPQAQVMNTQDARDLRHRPRGGPPADANGMFRMYAVDKATGKEVGAVADSSRAPARRR